MNLYQEESSCHQWPVLLEPFFLAFPQKSLAQGLWASCTSWLWGWHYSACDMSPVQGQPAWMSTPSLSGAGQLVATPAEIETHAFCGSYHFWTLDLFKYHQKRNMTHWNSVVFFKKFILIVYSLDDSVCIVHAPKLWRSSSLSPPASVAYLDSYVCFWHLLLDAQGP